MSRVLYAPRNISGQASLYQQAIAPFGFTSQVWSYTAPAFGFSVDRVIDEEQALNDVEFRKSLLAEALGSFDIFHFQFGRSLFPVRDELPLLWDLPLLRSMGKTVIMHFRGSEVRRKSAHLLREEHSYFRTGGPSREEKEIDAMLLVCRAHCDQLLVSTPGLLDDVPDATWLPHLVDAELWDCDRGPEPDVPVVVHTPSRRSTKSSDSIDAVCSTLDAEGIIEYRTPSGVTGAAFRDLLSHADIVIDSLGIGDHGALSVETMAAGAIAIAHIHPDNRDRNVGVPVVEADPTTLDSVLRNLANDPARRQNLRAAGSDWIRTHHDLPVVGAQLASIYQASSTMLPETRGLHSHWPIALPDTIVHEALARLQQHEQTLRRLQPIRSRARRTRRLALDLGHGLRRRSVAQISKRRSGARLISAVRERSERPARHT